jgi:hypothetical protein
MRQGRHLRSQFIERRLCTARNDASIVIFTTDHDLAGPCSIAPSLIAVAAVLGGVAHDKTPASRLGQFGRFIINATLAIAFLIALFKGAQMIISD